MDGIWNDQSVTLAVGAGHKSRGSTTKVVQHGCDILFIGYSAAAFFDSSEIKINSWTHAARKIRGPMSPTMHPRDVICVLEKAAFENKYPVCNDGRVIIEEEHLGRKAELRCSTRNYLAP